MGLHALHTIRMPKADDRCGAQCRQRLDAVLEEQARAIGQNLHDEASQLLAAAHLVLAEVSREAPASIGARLRDVNQHLEHVEDHLRTVARELHPRELDEDGLVAALSFLGRAFEARHGIATDVHARLRRRLPDAVGTALYRVAQEGLTNIGRHARAQHAGIRIWMRSGAVHCTIRDDGVGFDAWTLARGGGGLGLPGMRARVAALRGALTIRSASGQGTRLAISIPMDH
jgi:two-component system sensor histidine kinase UhpB